MVCLRRRCFLWVLWFARCCQFSTLVRNLCWLKVEKSETFTLEKKKHSYRPKSILMLEEAAKLMNFPNASDFQQFEERKKKQKMACINVFFMVSFLFVMNVQKYIQWIKFWNNTQRCTHTPTSTTQKKNRNSDKGFRWNCFVWNIWAKSPFVTQKDLFDWIYSVWLLRVWMLVNQEKVCFQMNFL